VLFGRPAGVLLLAMLRDGRPWSIAIVNFDLVAGTLHGTLVPGGTPMSTAGGGSATIADALDLGHAELGRFQIDDIIGRGFGLSIDDYLLIDGTLTPGAADVRSAVDRLSTWTQLPRLAESLFRNLSRSSLPVVQSALLIRGFHELDLGTMVMSEPTGSPDEITQLVRARVGPGERPRSPRDALKLVEWA